MDAALDQRILNALKNARHTIERLQQTEQEAIAIIGIGCRFPGGVDSPESYWQLLSEGKDAVIEVPAERWSSQNYYHPEPATPGFSNTNRAAFIEHIDQFDPQFFNISPREAVNLDPQQRLVLETAWEALERAGCMPERLAGTRAGVFIGITANDYAQLSDDRARYDAYFNSGNSLNVAAGRLSYTLGFTGPSMAIDTACSSSLSAVHLACQSLKQRECDLALAGGVNLMLLVQNFVALSQASMLSPDGHCKTFDAAANGYVRGEGCGMVVLKRLSDALADRDNILAVIRGSAVNQDGASGGLTVPNGLAQQAVIEQALSNAKVSPDMIAYVEAHGTGTPLGDPIEVNALSAVFGASHSFEQPLYIGSVKTNIGHLESAAGIAGLIKLVLALQHQQIPKQLHYQTPNPHIDWAHLPVKVVDTPIAWPRNDKRRLAGVSAFGFSGTNAHIIIEEAPLPLAPNNSSHAPAWECIQQRSSVAKGGINSSQAPRGNSSRDALRPVPPELHELHSHAEHGNDKEGNSNADTYHLLPLSAKTEAALQALQQRYLDQFNAQPELDFAAVCYTAALGRQHFNYRSAIIAANLGQAKQQLQAQLAMWKRRPGRDESVAPTTSPTSTINTPWHSIKTRYLQGEKIDWAAVYDHRKQPKISLPTYPFQRQRYWLGANNSTNSQTQNSGHPLLGGKIASALRTVQYQTLLSPEQPVWLADHRLPPHIVFPATGYLELALAAGKQLLHSDQLSVQQLNISQALLVDGRISVQTLLEPTASGYHFTIASCPEAQQHQGVWTQHAEGELSLSHASEPAQPTVAARIDNSIDIDAYYQSYRDQGLDYGQSFQNIRSLSAQDNSVTGLIALAAPEQQNADKYLLHPALLDSCLQLLKAALPQDNLQRYLPVALEQLTLYRSGADAAYCQATLTAADSAINPNRPEHYQADLKIYDAQGRAIAELKRLSLRPVSTEQLSSDSQKTRPLDSYRIVWQQQPLDSQNQAPSPSESSSQLLFIEPGKLAEQLNIQLPNSHLVSMGASGSAYQQLDARHSQIDPLQPEHYRRLLSDHPDAVSFIHAWSESQSELGTEIETSADSLITQAQQHSCGSVLLLVQALTASSAVARSLTLITRGAQAVYRNSGDQQTNANISNTGDYGDSNHSNGQETALQSKLNPLQAPLLGLAKVIVLEHPELQCLCIDLDPDANTDTATEAKHLVQELHQPKPAQNQAPIAEDQIAYRQGQRYIPRLQQHSGKASSSSAEPTQPKQQRLQLASYGIEQLKLSATSPVPAPTAGQLQINVSASGLNFKDVLHALGMLKFPDSEVQNIPFGFECAGSINQIGANVKGFNIGDRVMAVLTPGSMADCVNVDTRYVIHTPNNLSDIEAAALPLAYLTASYGLEQLAQIKPGDSILIHAAAGGVGQAAIQIAQQHGLTIYASAHPDKWPRLKAQGIQHLYHSRQANYAEAINQATGGKGVDIILNSLSGDFIDENLRCLAANGHFIEIGKLGILSPEQMQQHRPDVDYHVFDLGEIGRQQPELIQSLFQSLGEQLQQQTLKPLPIQSYPLERASEAFQCMAKAQHQGKIVLTNANRINNTHTNKIKAQHSYLITGGLGGLGLKLADWLIEQGATHLVLNSINPANEQAQQQLQALQQRAHVELIIADISEQAQTQQLFQQIKTSQPPLVGIIHAAGKLDDSMLQQLDWTRFYSVLKPKINGSWHLHHYSQHLLLDFFIEFSSATALLGAPGQGNYAAANAFQDALAHYRKLQGLPALSINWGPWGEVGMAARLSENADHHWQTQGIKPLNPQAALQALSSLLNGYETQVALMQIDWPVFNRRNPSALLTNLAQIQAPRKAEHAFIERLNAQPVDQQQNYLNEWLCEQVCAVLALPKTTAIEPRERLFDFGLDSLMAVELKNRLDHATAKKLRSTLIFDYPTLETLGRYLAEQLLVAAPQQPPQAQQEPDLFELNDLLDALEKSSDDEAIQRLMN